MKRTVIILALAAGSAQAAPFAVPQGCQAYLTVQTRACTVSHHWTCAADNPANRSASLDA